MFGYRLAAPAGEFDALFPVCLHDARLSWACLGPFPAGDPARGVQPDPLRAVAAAIRS
jgi:hypothetical protein